MSAPTYPGTSAWRPRRRPLGGRALLASLMLLVTVASAFPLVWMVLSSLKTTAETMQVPPVWIPRSPNLDAYEKVAGVVNVGRSMWNSLVIASITTAGILLTSMMAGYAFAKYRFRGRTRAVLAADRHHVPAADRHADPALPDDRLARSQRQPRRRDPSQPRQCLRHLPDAAVHMRAYPTTSSTPPASTAPPSC